MRRSRFIGRCLHVCRKGIAHCSVCLQTMRRCDWMMGLCAGSDAGPCRMRCPRAHGTCSWAMKLQNQKTAFQDYYRFWYHRHPSSGALHINSLLGHGSVVHEERFICIRSCHEPILIQCHYTAQCNNALLHPPKLPQECASRVITVVNVSEDLSKQSIVL